MPRLIKIVMAGLIIAGFPCIGYAQSDIESDIQRVYQQFSAAHDSLDVDLVGSLYAKDALYLAPNPEEGLRRGRESILRSFRGTFETARKRGSRLKMTFRIVERDVEGDMAYDVGYYKFEAFPKEGEPFQAAGKFVTVLKRGGDGAWRFHVDAYSDAPLSAFRAAEE